MKYPDPIIFVIGMILGLVLGELLGEVLMESKWLNEAISQGFAEHNQTNGNWQWKEGGK